MDEQLAIMAVRDCLRALIVKRGSAAVALCYLLQ
jgi:hypothetical protein